MNPCFETATSLARAIRNKKLTSREATEAHLDRIGRLNESINALVVVDREGALKAARAADRTAAKKGATLGPLHGVPITIKEAFDVAGLRTTSSHPPLKDNVATADASLVARLRAAGAVAARLSPLELGSDIGGSVRNPAHYNGIFSLKPTEWRVPSRGHVPDLPGKTRVVRYMGVFGPLARSVDDLETALRIVAGPDGHEAEAPPVPIGPVPKLKASDLRIAVLESNPLVEVSQDTAKAVQATAKLLSKAGAKVKRAAPEGLDWTQSWEDWCDLFQYLINALQPLEVRERFFPMIDSDDPSARSAARGARLDMAAFFAVLDRRDQTMRRCESLLDDYDAWLMPVMPGAAFVRQSQKEPLVIDGRPYPYFFAGTAYNHLANLTGQPSLVLPCGFSKEGLPIGLQLTGKRWGEAKLLAVAKVLEKLLPPCPVPTTFA
jgi:amidase